MQKHFGGEELGLKTALCPAGNIDPQMRRGMPAPVFLMLLFRVGAANSGLWR